jgi:uncharacterized protein YkwD
VKFRITIPIIAALAMTACAEAPSGKIAPAQKLALSQVTLEPDTARRMINSYRATRGLQPISLEKRLTRAARRHSQDLAKGDRISHTGSDGSDPWSRVKVTGYKPKLAAENVGAGQMSFAEVLQGWKESPGHNRNLLLADATQMGIALVTNPGSRYRTFWTLVLGKPRG